jgi:hypothetical protein
MLQQPNVPPDPQLQRAAYNPTGNIVRRRFTTGIYHEGKINQYDPIDTDDITYDEILIYKKKNQRYE